MTRFACGSFSAAGKIGAAALVMVPALFGTASAGDDERSPFERSGSTIYELAGPVEDQPTPAGLPQVYSPPTANAEPTPMKDDQAPIPPTKRLRPITTISPFYDYDPDGDKPCKHLCPRPDGTCENETNIACPEEAEFLNVMSPDRHFADLTYMWCASNLYHHPLYFEDVQLERYGQVKCNEFTQPFVSAGKFGAQLVGLPYQMALDNPHDCRYALGYYRPGDPAPRLHYKVPLNGRAAAASVPWYTGIVFLLQ